MGLFGKSTKELNKEKIQKEAEEFLQAIKQRNGLASIVPDHNIFLKDAEKAYLMDDAILKEMRSVSKRIGGGMGIKLCKGVYVGGYKGESRSYPELRNIDKGKLILTNQRIIFDGVTENRIIPIKNVMSIQTHLDAIEISTEDKQKSSFFFVNNPYIWSAALSIVHSVPDPENLKDINLNIKFE